MVFYTIIWLQKIYKEIEVCLLKEKKVKSFVKWNLNEQAAPCVLEKHWKTSSAVLKSSWKVLLIIEITNTSDGYLLISIFSLHNQVLPNSHTKRTQQQQHAHTHTKKFYFTFKTMLHHSRYVILCHGFSLDSKFNQNIFTATFNTKRKFSVATVLFYLLFFHGGKWKTTKTEKKKDIKSTSEVGKIFFEEFNKRNNLIWKEEEFILHNTHTHTVKLQKGIKFKGSFL